MWYSSKNLGGTACVVPPGMHNTTDAYVTLVLRERVLFKPAAAWYPVILCDSYDGLVMKIII